MATDAGKLDSTAAPPQDNHQTTALPPSSVVVSSVDSKDSSADASKTSSLASAPAPATDTEKKIRRAGRFGITVQLSEQEKRNSRAERFGMGSTPKTTEKTADKNAEDLKRKARAERFGLPVAASADDEAKKKARLQRFAQPVKKDDKKDSQPSTNSLSMNGKGNIEPKAAIAGEAGGGS